MMGDVDLNQGRLAGAQPGDQCADTDGLALERVRRIPDAAFAVAGDRPISLLHAAKAQCYPEASFALLGGPRVSWDDIIAAAELRDARCGVDPAESAAPAAGLLNDWPAPAPSRLHEMAQRAAAWRERVVSLTAANATLRDENARLKAAANAVLESTSRMAEADGQGVQDRVDRVIEDLTKGRVVKPQVEKLGRAVDQAKRDHAANDAVGKAWR